MMKLLEPCFTEWQMICFVMLDESCRPIVDIDFNMSFFSFHFIFHHLRIILANLHS